MQSQICNGDWVAHILLYEDEDEKEEYDKGKTYSFLDFLTFVGLGVRGPFDNFMEVVFPEEALVWA